MRLPHAIAPFDGRAQPWRRKPSWPSHWIDRLAVAVAIGTPVAVSAALVPWRNSVPNTDVALGLVAVVVAVATLGRRVAAGLAALSAGISFDLFHTRPYESLAIAHGRDVETTALLLAVGLAVGELAARRRRDRYAAAEASYDIGRIHAVAELVAAGTPADEVIQTVRRELKDLLALKDCRFDPTFASRPGAFVERHGSVMWGSIQWGVSTLGLPGREVTLVVQGQGRPLGRFVLVPTPGVPVSLDHLIVAVALADQAGAALIAQATPA